VFGSQGPEPSDTEGTLPSSSNMGGRSDPFHGATVFTKLDVRNGFWHVKLDDSSSYLTTFNTPFDRYRSKHAVWDPVSRAGCMRGMSHVEVVADDFVLFVTDKQKSKRCETMMSSFSCGRIEDSSLNIEKLTLRKKEVSFTGPVMACEWTQTRLRLSATYPPLQTMQECRGH